MVFFVAALFTAKFYMSNRALAHKIYSSPSVVVLAPGRMTKAAVAHVAGHENVRSHNGMHVAHLGKSRIVVAPQNHHRNVEGVRKMNSKAFVYMFDPAYSIAGQVEAYRNYRRMFSGKKFIAAAHGNAALMRKHVRVHDLSTPSGLKKFRSSVRASFN